MSRPYFHVNRQTECSWPRLHDLYLINCENPLKQSRTILIKRSSRVWTEHWKTEAVQQRSHYRNFVSWQCSTPKRFLEHLKWDVLSLLSHPSYSPDIASSDYLMLWPHWIYKVINKTQNECLLNNVSLSIKNPNGPCCLARSHITVLCKWWIIVFNNSKPR